ncbi:MAG: glycoside hydrolase family 31 protein [Verrucomicrobiota bacterium]|nr:glycoside hydrolase family 31 protein [Verrucomicrobiota bacterium]
MASLIKTDMIEYLRNVNSCKEISNGILLEVDRELVRIEVIKDNILRIKISQNRIFDENPTWATDFKLPSNPKFTVNDSENSIVLSTDKIELSISKDNFSMNCIRNDGTNVFSTCTDTEGKSIAYGYLNNKFIITRKYVYKDNIYGLGEKTGQIDKSGENYVMWNTDILAPDTHHHFHLSDSDPKNDPTSNVFDPYYVSIPFFYHIPADKTHRNAAGFFIDNSYKAFFEFTNSNQYRFQFNGGQYTEYIFAGPSMKDILSEYTWVTGRMQAPPIWALGYHQCRWFPYIQEELEDMAEKFVKEKIPCDTLWIDIDYMDGYRVFTWNKDKFPEREKMIQKLEDMGIRVITIIDPGVKYEPGNPVFDEAVEKNLLCKAENGQLYIGAVWPGRTVFPDFTKEETREWWGELNAEHVKSGLAGIWNDMNEPATGVINTNDMLFDIDGENFSHERIHNQYAILMAMGTRNGLLKAMPEKRTFILSRAGSPGIQRYSANWMGDNMSRWEHLEMSIAMGSGLGISGQPFVGADAGGFGESATAELLIRWMQYATFTPFFRNHNSDKKDQYLWSFGKATKELCKKTTQMRYRLMPYVYSQFMEASKTGEPIQRPLVYDYQSDKTVANISDEYLFGKKILVAPICKAGQTSRSVYLPEGAWYNLNTGEINEGNSYVTAEAPMEFIPTFVKAGSIIPMLQKIPVSTMNLHPEQIDLHVFVPLVDGSYTDILHEDDGLTFNFQKGKYLRTFFTLSKKDGVLLIKASVSGNGFAESARQTFRFIFHNLAKTTGKLNGNEVEIKNKTLLVDNSGNDFELECYT